MKKAIIFFSFLGFLLSCATSIPGSFYTSTSKFDGTDELYVNPGWLKTGLSDVTGSTTFRLGLFKNSKMEKDHVYFIAMVKGARLVEDLLINIDGEITTFRSDDRTQIKTTDSGNWSSKRYSTTIEYIKKMIDG